MNEQPESSFRYAVRVVALVALTMLCLVAAVAALAYATSLFLVFFLAILFSVFLSRISRWISDHAPLTYAWSLAAVTTALVLLAALGVIFLGVRVDAQMTEAKGHFGQGAQRIQETARRYPTLNSLLRSTPFAQQILDDAIPQQDGARQDGARPQNPSPEQGQPSSELQNPQDAPSPQPAAEQEAMASVAAQAAPVVASVFQTTFDWLLYSLLIFFVGLFVAIAPGKHRDGVVLLFPLGRRERTREIMDQMGDTLWHWLIGRFATMLVTGIGSTVLLMALGVPMAVTIGIVTALLSFIPNIGAIVALLLSVLIALPQGNTVVLLVIVGYIVLQLIESYVVTPLIQQHQASLPPALLIAFQAVMGVLFGILGAAVASPLLAAAKVLVEEAYIHDVLEQPDRQPPG